MTRRMPTPVARIRTFLRGDVTPPVIDPGVTRPKIDKDLDRLLAAKKAEGYIECLDDLRTGMKRHATNSFALMSMEPVMRNVMLKASVYEAEFGD